MSTKDCLLQCGNMKNKKVTYLKEWDKLKEYSLRWKGLDKFGKVYESVDWEKGPSGHWVHNNCKFNISSNDRLVQAQVRKRKELEQNVQEDAVASHSRKEEPAPKRLRSNTGTIHDKNKCIWCLEPSDKKHNKKLLLITLEGGWTAFKNHTVILKDQDMRERINLLIDYIGDEYVSNEIRYHKPCWNKYVRYDKDLTDDQSIPQLQNVRLREAQTIFMNHVRLVIFKDHELRSLQNLLDDYKQILSKYGLSLDGIKSSYVKEILIKEFKNSIGFHARPQRNVSELVYDTSAGGSYIEAAITSMGVSDEQLMSNLMKRLIEEVKAVGTVPWPPSVDELAEEEKLSPLLLSFVSSMRGKSNIDLSPKVLALTSLLTQFILGKPTKTSINSTITIHGITRSKEIVDNNDKLGLGISYANVLYLRDFWALQDLQTAESCPVEIAEGKPGISIVDNDDFSNDTLTGGGTSHRTNWMMIQKQVTV